MKITREPPPPAEDIIVIEMTASDADHLHDQIAKLARQGDLTLGNASPLSLLYRELIQVL